METFKVRLNCLDHYQASPSDLDPPLFGQHGSTQRASAPSLPVIRVFGSTETGQKVCAHVHGALPYLYIEYRGSLDKSAVDIYIQQLRTSIDHALAVSYRRNIYESNVVYVAHISIVKGVPFFGYHVGYRNFLKIYLLNPLHMTRFADLLYQGSIMNQVLQPFEAHAQYLAQWMCDYNLYGCAYMDCKVAKFRSPVPEYVDLQSTSHTWDKHSIPERLILDSAMFPRQSYCSIEVDVCVQDILNRNEVHERDVHHDFKERFEHLRPEEKLVHSLAGLWKDETRRRKFRMGLTDPSSTPFPPEILLSMSADSRDDGDAGWIHEEELRERIKSLIEDEKPEDPKEVAFEDFVVENPLQKSIQTALQSVEDLFPSKLRASLTTPGSPASDDVVGDVAQPEALVDENGIPDFDEGDFPCGSDEDISRQLALSQNMLVQGNKQAIAEAFVNGRPRNSAGANDELLLGPTNAGRETPSVAILHNPHDILSNLGEGATINEEGVHADVSECAILPVNNGDSKSNSATEVVQSRKRQKLSHFGSPSNAKFEFGMVPDEVERSRSKHAHFADVPGQNDGMKNRNQSPGMPASQDSNTPRNSQLSQSSIKAQGSELSRTGSFQVVKDPYRGYRGKSAPVNEFLPNSSPSKKGHNVTVASKSTSKSSSSWSRSSQAPRSSSSISSVSGHLVKMLGDFDHGFGTGKMRNVYAFTTLPPTVGDVEATIRQDGRPDQIFQDAYYSDDKDVPERSRDYAGREFKLESTTVPFLPDFDPLGASLACFGSKPPIIIDAHKQEHRFQRNRYSCNLRTWEIAALPPLRIEVEAWGKLQKKDLKKSNTSNCPDNSSPRGNPQETKKYMNLSQIDGPTQANRHGFKFSRKQTSTSVQHETQYMSTMSLEVHVNTRENLVPDPEHDEVAFIFWCISSDSDEVSSNGLRQGTRVGIIALTDQKDIGRRVEKETGIEVDEEDTELDVINRIVDVVRDLDPDILTGFEVHNGSWGYLIERARIKFEYNLCDEFSRMMSHSHGRFGKDSDRWGFDHTSTIRITGRHMINIWRAMRGELDLLQYTMENLAFHVLHKRIPHYSCKDLTEWYVSNVPHDLAKLVGYYLSRVQMDLEILEVNELIPRTSEQARILGVDFFSVISRGSQFKVESFMFRIAKPENFLLVSPSKKQVGQQNALECLPLVMEPQSDFYNSPLLVLDFQSLYPSIMIAYNYCYSTCLGRVVHWRGQNKMGFADFQRQPRLLELVKDHVNVAPNGMMYVKPEMRKSLLAKMLGEILETRVMVKSGMKSDKDDKTLQQLLNNRQLALKLLANVTYGYTSASFSGRMPCAEIADSIVQTARETLEKTIAFIHSVTKWDAEVVYGDTDSLFIYLKGRTKEQAFEIGNEISEAVTKRNPRPIKLKFEKVYHPCVLLAKKRYVGFKYETPSQVEPEFDAKGIETVRRDGTPAEQKIEEKALKLLFRTSDLSQVKAYFQRQCSKIMSGRISVQDFCFAKEVRLGSYSDKGPPPPGALVSTRRMLRDPRTEPQYGERVPYVVITGAPGARLIDRCVAPDDLLKDDSAELDAEYYISKNLIPPLERIFNLVGANVRQWYDEMPKIQRIRDLQLLPTAVAEERTAAGRSVSKKTLESYMKSSHCLVCRTKLNASANKDQVDESRALPLCVTCLDDRALSLYTLRTRLQIAQDKLHKIEKICRSCSGFSWAEDIKCDSKDCPVFYSRVRAKAVDSRGRRVVDKVIEELEQGTNETENLAW